MKMKEQKLLILEIFQLKEKWQTYTFTIHILEYVNYETEHFTSFHVLSEPP